MAAARQKLPEAAFAVIRNKRYAATTVDELCAEWAEQSLALDIEAVLQGAFTLAKAKDSTDIAADSVDHPRRYAELLF